MNMRKKNKKEERKLLTKGKGTPDSKKSNGNKKSWRLDEYLLTFRDTEDSISHSAARITILFVNGYWLLTHCWLYWLDRIKKINLCKEILERNRKTLRAVRKASTSLVYRYEIVYSRIRCSSCCLSMFHGKKICWLLSQPLITATTC